MSLLLDSRGCSSTPTGKQPTADALPAANALSSWYGYLLHAGATALLFGLILWAYHPSLDHVHRSDQWCFLLETIDQDSFPAAFARTYSFSRTRRIAPGDYELYRPVLFALLSAEKGLFGTNLALWQGFGIGLHCLVVFLFLRILLLVIRLRTRGALKKEPAAGFFTEARLLAGLAYGLALFFGLNFAVVEMVIWSHINGYLLFIVFALAALLLVLKLLAEPEAPPARKKTLLMGAFLLLLLSAFTYEIGQFFSVLVGVVLAARAFQHGQRCRALAVFVLFASILPLYQAVNFLDQLSHPRAVGANLQKIPKRSDRARGEEEDLGRDAHLKTIAARAASVATLEHTVRYLQYTLVQPFFPSCAKWAFFTQRILIDEPVFAWENFEGDSLPILSLAVFGAGLLLLLRGLFHFATGPDRRQMFLLTLLPFSLFVLHAAVVVLGRMNLRPGPMILRANSYYAYLPLLGVLLSLSVACACAGSPTARRVPTLVFLLYAVLLVGLGVLSIHSGIKVHAMNLVVKTGLRPVRLTIKNLNHFIDEHKAEADFSFAIDTSCHHAKPPHGVPVAILLFKRYINNRDPKYVFHMEEGKLAAKRYDAADFSRDGGPHLPQLFPDLVRVDPFYNFYYFDGWYYGVQCQDGYFRPEQVMYEYLIVDATLEGAQRQVPLKFAERLADFRSGKYIPPQANITLVETGFRGFDLYEANERIYAIPSSEFPLDRTWILHDRYSPWYCGDTAEAVKSQILAREIPR